LHVVQTLELPQKSQFKVDGQEVHDRVELFHVNPDKQHPGEELGCRLYPLLQTAHLFAWSHL